MVIFIKVKDSVKNKLNNQLAATFFFQYKTYGGKIMYRQGPGGVREDPRAAFTKFFLENLTPMLIPFFYRHIGWQIFFVRPECEIAEI